MNDVMMTMKFMSVLCLLFWTGVYADVQLPTKRQSDDLDQTVIEILATVSELKEENAALKHDVTALSDDNARQNEQIEMLIKASFNAKDISIEQANTHDKSLHKTMKGLNPTPELDTYSQFTEFACTQSTVNITCPSGRTIIVSSAVYGVYWTGSACTGCCPPNPGWDCSELVEENSPQDWLAIKVLCDNQTTCAFEVSVSGIDDCAHDYETDYMQLFYDCLPDDETAPVAFTAWAKTGNPTSYNSGDVVVFDEVLSNFGGHYNPATSSFTCPVDGVYLLSVSMTPTAGDAFIVDLMRNGIRLARTHGGAISGVHNPVSTTVVTECTGGEMLWVRAGSTGTMRASDQYSVFTGHLIQRL